MSKLILAIIISVFSLSVFAEEIILKNTTDKSTLNAGGPTSIKLKLIVDNRNNLNNNNLDELILAPGQQVKVDIDSLPRLDKNAKLLVKYMHSSENLLLGFTYTGPSSMLGIHKIGMVNKGNPDFGPNFDIEYSGTFNIKKINFGYSNSFEANYS